MKLKTKDMDVTELRIGNWTHNNVETLQVKAKDLVFLLAFDNEHYANPVELTLEWLTKFGFHSDQGDELGVYRRQVGNNLDFMVNLITHEAGFSMGWRNDFCSIWREVKYAHEVQNIIYFLSKEELEVK